MSIRPRSRRRRDDPPRLSDRWRRAPSSPRMRDRREGPVTLRRLPTRSRRPAGGRLLRRLCAPGWRQPGTGRPRAWRFILEEQSGGARLRWTQADHPVPLRDAGQPDQFLRLPHGRRHQPPDHTEVGSSYIHFNFTPDGDKTTASLFGDVPRGVMLNQPPIFLGGQGGTVGPVPPVSGPSWQRAACCGTTSSRTARLSSLARWRNVVRPRLHGPYRGLTSSSNATSTTG